MVVVVVEIGVPVVMGAVAALVYLGPTEAFRHCENNESCW